MLRVVPNPESLRQTLPKTIFLSLLLGVIFLATALWSFSVGIADYFEKQKTVAATKTALKFSPLQAPYWLQLSLLTYDDDPGLSRAALDHTLQLNPRDSTSMIEVGLRQEAGGNLSAAESTLLRAAAIDHLYLPRWSLANFYLRTGRMEDFWLWAGAAATTSQNEPPFALYKLCWRVSDDGAMIEQRMTENHPPAIARYLTYLLSRHETVFASHEQDVAGPTADHLASQGRVQDTDSLIRTVDRLLREDNSAPAIAVWNKMAVDHRIPYSILDPTNGISLTNGAFNIPPMTRGFDWQLPKADGLTIARESEQGGLRIRLTGEESEALNLLAEPLPVLPGRKYEVSYTYQTENIPRGSGILWVLSDDSERFATSEDISSDVETTQTFTFTIPVGVDIAFLRLIYERQSGTVPPEGSLLIHEVSLKLL